MTPKQFSSLVKLTDQLEKQKATLVAFYMHMQKDMESFSVNALVDEMLVFGLSKPNIPRLKKNILDGKTFIRAGVDNVKLHLKKIESLERAFPEVLAESEEILSEETILPEALFHNTRGYLTQVAMQINACYHYRIYDGCAMLMRRLIEMLIILSYQAQKREDDIKDSSGGYQPLSYMIRHAQSNKVLGLNKPSDEILDNFRELGNYSAHGVAYNARKKDLDKVKIPFRACVEEMLYKSGIKK